VDVASVLSEPPLDRPIGTRRPWNPAPCTTRSRHLTASRRGAPRALTGRCSRCIPALLPRWSTAPRHRWCHPCRQGNEGHLALPRGPKPAKLDTRRSLTRWGRSLEGRLHCADWASRVCVHRDARGMCIARDGAGWGARWW